MDILSKYFWHRKYNHRHKSLEVQYRKILSINHIPNEEVEGEKLWIKKWSQLGLKVSPVQYRVFSHYIGPNLNIVPEEVSHYCIEPILNDRVTSAYYRDKNCFDKILPSTFLPKTILRRIRGFYYDSAYNNIVINDMLLEELLMSSSNQRVIIKPCIDSSSGNGVKMFHQFNKNGKVCWQNVQDGKEVLNIQFLANYGSDFIIQEAIEQHPYISQFNDSSVNTVRLAIYRSVIDNECHVLGTIMRIGGKGSVVDNIHAGGYRIGINLDGSFCKELCNQYGQKVHVFNDIDFSQDYKYPNWADVIMFAKQVGQKLLHQRLVALDIALDKQGSPVLIEYNCNIGSFSTAPFQFTLSPAFGKYTDEIIEYCKEIISKSSIYKI